MLSNCKSCNELITGNFCINCGQKKFKRIDKKYIVDEVQYTFLHTNKGLLYSLKNILKNPGKTANEFIEGNRVNHYKPILLLFLISGFSTFLSFKVLGFKQNMGEIYNGTNLNSRFGADLMTFLSNYYNIFIVALIPFFALITKAALRRWGHNYYEHIIINTYILIYYSLVGIIFTYPILFFFRNSSASVLVNISQLSFLLVPFILVWFFKGFYQEKSVKTIIFKVLAIIGLFILAFLVVMILAILVGVIVAILNKQGANELIKYTQPK